MSSSTLHRWVRSGHLVRLTPRVFRVAGSPQTSEQRDLAAVLDATGAAALSHRSAARRWGLPGFDGSAIDVTSGARAGRQPGLHIVRRHDPRCLLEHHIVELDGIPTTTPTRTIFDLAGDRTMHPKRIERTLDTAMARQIVSPASLERMLRELARRGRPGITVMRELVAARSSAGYRPPESSLESRFHELASMAGVGAFERQVDIGSEAGWVGRVDFRHATTPLIVEIDSDRFHGSLTDRSRDTARHAALADAGFVVLSISGTDLFDRRAEVIERLRVSTELARRRRAERDAGAPEGLSR